MGCKEGAVEKNYRFDKKCMDTVFSKMVPKNLILHAGLGICRLLHYM